MLVRRNQKHKNRQTKHENTVFYTSLSAGSPRVIHTSHNVMVTPFLRKSWSRPNKKM